METQTIIQENFLYNMFLSLIGHAIKDGFKINELNSDDVQAFFYFTRTKNNFKETIKISYSYLNKRIWIEIIN